MVLSLFSNPLKSAIFPVAMSNSCFQYSHSYLRRSVSKDNELVLLLILPCIAVLTLVLGCYYSVVLITLLGVPCQKTDRLAFSLLHLTTSPFFMVISLRSWTALGSTKQFIWDLVSIYAPFKGILILKSEL